MRMPNFSYQSRDFWKWLVAVAFAFMGLIAVQAYADTSPVSYLETWSPVGDRWSDPGTCNHMPDYSIDEACYAAAVTASGRFTIEGWEENLQLGNFGVYEYITLVDEIIGGVIIQKVQIAVGPGCAQGGSPGYLINDAFGAQHVDWCLVAYHAPTCKAPLLLDSQTGQCYSPPEKHCNCSNQKGGKHPIDTGSGNEYLELPDYKAGGAFPLAFVRTYNSGIANEGTSPDGAAQNMGVGWNINLGSHLFINKYYPSVILTPCVDQQTGAQYFCVPDPDTTPYIIEITTWRPDGSQALFNYQTSGSTSVAPGTQFSDESGSSGTLTYVALPTPYTGDGYQYKLTDGSTELYDANGVLLSVSNRTGLTQVYQYNASGQLATVTDPFGRQLNIAYDPSGRISTLTTPAGNTTYTYDGAGNLSIVAYPDSSTVQYLYGNPTYPHALTGLIDENNNHYLTWGYDNQGRATSSSEAGNVENVSAVFNTDGSTDLTEATGLVRHMTFTSINHTNLLASTSAPCTGCGDKTQSLTYDANGYVASKTDFDNNVTQYTHDGFGNETSRTEAYGTPDARTVTTAWNNGLNQPSLITEPGRTTAFTYDTVGHVLTKTVTDTTTSVARTTTYTYYSSGVPNGLLHTVTDPLSHVTTYTYDGQGNLATVTNALNQVTQITQYDANGMPLTIVDPNNVTTTLTYDTRQRLKSRTVAGAETDFTYDLVGNLTKVTLPTGSFLQYTYDAAHRLTGITDSVGDSITYTLDNLGNRTAEKTYDPSSTLEKTLQRTYNTLNQLVTTVGGAGQTTTYTPDLMGNDTAITDPLTHPTNQTFDALNRLSTVVDPLSGNTTYNYDSLDRVQDVTDPKGLNTDYSYDAFGDVTTQTSPDTGITAYTYDLDGNRLTKTDARGVTATYSYDALNRLTTISYPDTNKDVTYSYDQNTYGIGHLSGMTDASGSTTYSYDAHGNTTQKTVTLGGHVFNVGYQYDTADNLTGMTYPDGMQVNYGRDTAERVTSVTANSSSVVSNVTYEPFGPITGFTYGNGLTEIRTYDQDYRLTTIDVPGVLQWTIPANGYDADDNIKIITDGLNAGNSQAFGYDSLNRLTSASGAYGALGFTYDADGNRTQQTLGGTPTTLTYDTASNKLLTVGNQSDQYDAVGNLLSDGKHTYTYDASNRLSGYDTSANAYLYNGLGQRTVKSQTTLPPTVSITGPASGAFLRGTVTVSANASASGNVGMASVQFQLDGANLGAPVTAAPYAVSWNTTTATGGIHSLTAVATDAANNTTTSTAVSVTVDNTPPSVAMTVPASGAYLRGTVSVTANASDNNGVVSVQFQLDGANLGAPVTAAPYTVSWDSTTATGGTHSLTAVATDAANNTTTSTAVSVTVDNTPPTVAIIAPAGGNVSGTINVTATASDDVGVTSVQFQLDGANLGAPVTAAPYTVSWSSFTALGSHTLTAVATDAAGNSTTSAAVSVTAVDIAPTANNGSLTTNPGVTGSGTLSATLGYVGQTLTFAVVTAPIHGSVTITNAASGAFTYTPNTGYTGSDSFTFQATDEDNTVSNTATESVTINDVAATANNGALTTNAGVAGNGTLAVTLGYTSQTLTFAVAAGPSHGTVAITDAATGAFTYTPAAGYVGADSFTFKATDSYGSVSNTATEGITVNALTALPSFSPSSLQFGNVNRANISTLTETLTNNGTGTLTITSVLAVYLGPGPNPFGAMSNCGHTLAAGNSCTISVRFRPSGDGSVTGSLQVVDNATSGPTAQSIPLNGTGVN